MADSSTVLKNSIPLVKIGGLYFAKNHFTEENILDTINFKPVPGDIFLVTYPKSGTTWAQYIMWNILTNAESNPALMDMTKNHIPFLEVSGIKVTEELPKPRIMKTHLPFKQNPYHPEAKYIYIARNAKDVCVSYYHFVHQLSPEFKDGTISDFFEMYVEDKVGYGGWYDHVYSWYLHKDDPNVLILTYEWMKENHRETVLKIADFMGTQYKDELDENPFLLDKIVQNTTFGTMKKIHVDVKERVLNTETNEKESENNDGKESTEQQLHFNTNSKDFVFFRKGEVGDWKNHLTKSQVQRLNKKLLSKSEIASVMTLWGNLWKTDDLHDE